MNRIEFMTELAALLQDVPEEERMEAMRYYNDYFEDAGEENEQQVIGELESPEKVAGTIKADLGNQDDIQGEYTENGYTDSRFEQRSVPECRQGQENQTEGTQSNDNCGTGQKYDYWQPEQKENYQQGNYRQGNYQQGDYRQGNYQQGDYKREFGQTGTEYADEAETKPRTNKALKIVLIMILAIAAAPVLIPVMIAVVAVVFGLIVAAFAVFAALVITSVAVAFAGICVFISGLISLIPEIAVGLALVGTGLILTVLGVIATVASVRLCLIVFPGICRGIVWLIRKPFHRKAVA